MNLRKSAYALVIASTLPACGAAPATTAAEAPVAPAPANPSLGKLTPDKAVFVYVDFLSGLDDYLTTVPGKQYRNNVQAFVKFHDVYPSVPVGILGDEGAYRGAFYPEVQGLVDDGRVFERTTPTGYTPEFAEWLKATGRQQIVLGGISIDNCTLHTALDLRRAGYEVYVLVDVSATNNPLAEESAIARLQRAGVVTTTWISASTELLADWNSEEGGRLAGVMNQHMAASTVGAPDDPSADMNPAPATAPSPATDSPASAPATDEAASRSTAASGGSPGHERH